MPSTKQTGWGTASRVSGQTGLTLVEALFAVVIGVMVVGMMMILYTGANNNLILGIALADVNSDGRLAMDNIIRDVRWANQLETSRTISGTNYVTGDNELVMRIPSIDGTGTVISGTYDYVAFALDSSDTSKLRRIMDPDGSSSRSSSDRMIADNINAFALSSAGTGLSSVGSLSGVTAVEISLTVSKTVATNRTVSQTIDSVAELRND